MPRSASRILITGAAGFVGSHVVAGWLAAGTEVHALVRPGSDLWRLVEHQKNSQLHLHEVELLKARAVTQLIAQIKPTFVYHLAAHGAYRWQQQTTAIFETNIQGTLNVLSALRAHPPQLLVNVGSSSEYGAKTKPMTEVDLLEPTTAYAAAKAAQTLLCQAEAQTVPYPIVTTRFFTIYGPQEDAGKIIPVLLRAAATSQAVQLAKPEFGHDYVFVNDVVTALLGLAKKLPRTGQIFNLGSGQQTTLRQLVATVAEVTGQKISAEWGAYVAPTTDSQLWVANTTKTQRELGWRATTSLAAGVQETWQWYKQSHAN